MKAPVVDDPNGEGSLNLTVRMKAPGLGEKFMANIVIENVAGASLNRTLFVAPGSQKGNVKDGTCTAKLGDGEEMIVETWIERNAHMLSVRDFRIYQAQEDGTERLIGCAKSVWAVLDLTSREIVNIFDHEMFDGAVDGEVLNMARAPRLKPIQLDDIEDENAVTGEILHEIQYSDVDYNCPCNSCKYLEWMVNAVQAFDNQKPFRLDINYVKELYQGDIMYTRFLKTENAVQYQQVDENGITCCNAMISKIDNIGC